MSSFIAMLPQSAGALPSAAAPSFKSPAEIESPIHSIARLRAARGARKAPLEEKASTLRLPCCEHPLTRDSVSRVSVKVELPAKEQCGLHAPPALLKSAYVLM